MPKKSQKNFGELDLKIKEVRKTIEKERKTSSNDRWNYLQGYRDGLLNARMMWEYEKEIRE